MQMCHEKDTGAWRGTGDYAWMAPVVVEARKCNCRDAGCGQSVVLRWVEAGVQGMDSAGYGAEQVLQGERGGERNGCLHRATMPGSVKSEAEAWS